MDDNAARDVDADQVIIDGVLEDDDLGSLTAGNIPTDDAQRICHVAEMKTKETRIHSGKLPRDVLPLQYLVQQGKAAERFLLDRYPREPVTAHYALHLQKRRSEGDLDALVAMLDDAKRVPSWGISHGSVSVENGYAKLDVRYAGRHLLSLVSGIAAVNLLMAGGARMDWFEMPAAINVNAQTTLDFAIGMAVAVGGLGAAILAYRARDHADTRFTTYIDMPKHMRKELVAACKERLPYH